jgi:hypothetical protein
MYLSCRDCCCCCDGDNYMFTNIDHAGHMEDKHMVDCSLLSGAFHCRRSIFFICAIQIRTRWFPTLGLCTSPNIDNGNMTLRASRTLPI